MSTSTVILLFDCNDLSTSEQQHEWHCSDMMSPDFTSRLLWGWPPAFCNLDHNTQTHTAAVCFLWWWVSDACFNNRWQRGILRGRLQMVDTQRSKPVIVRVGSQKSDILPARCCTVVRRNSLVVLYGHTAVLDIVHCPWSFKQVAVLAWYCTWYQYRYAGRMARGLVETLRI